MLWEDSIGSSVAGGRKVRAGAPGVWLWKAVALSEEVVRTQPQADLGEEADMELFRSEQTDSSLQDHSHFL